MSHVKIPKQLIYLWDTQIEPFGVKDCTSTFVYANQAYIDLLALPDRFDVSGRKDGELPAPTSEFQAQFQAHDRLVELTRQIKRSLEVHPFGRDRQLQAYYFEKMPFYNEHGEIVGTLFHGYKASNLRINFNHVASTSIILSPPDNTFSKREWDIVFLLLKGKTQKEVSVILSLSYAGIKQRVSWIFNKAGVNSVHELRLLSEENGWINYFPEHFVPHGHFLL